MHGDRPPRILHHAGVGRYVRCFDRIDRRIGEQAAWLVLWIVAYGLVAFGLQLATLKTFNRCLGRIDDRMRSGGPFPRPARKPATGLPDAEPALDLDLRRRPPAPLADPLSSDH